MVDVDERPILILGAAGQVGSKATLYFKENALGLTRKEVDIAKTDTLKETLRGFSPLAIINAAAYTAVDKAESEEKLAYAANATAPGIMAELAKELGIPLVHFSTDYVFPGSGQKPWHETDETGPLNVYGKTKLAGEKKIIATGGEYLIFRTSWVYAEEGANFLNTMLRLGQEKERLEIVSDQVGAPSYAGDLVDISLKALAAALKKDVFPSGIYHICNKGEASWYSFADEIFQLSKKYNIELKLKSLKPIKTADFPTPAKRPLNSRLSMEKLESAFKLEMPSWQEGLRRCMKNKFGKKNKEAA